MSDWPDVSAARHERQRRADAYTDLVESWQRQRDELARLRADYRTLWGMTLGHDGQPPDPATPDDVERLRQRFTDLNGEGQ
jgi:hypothetical protein